MAQLSVAGSIPAKLEDFLGSHKDTTVPVIDGFIRGQVTTANPADFASVTDASGLNVAVGTLTGVAVGDIVVGYGPVSGLVANSFIVAAYVSAANEVTFVFGNVETTAVTTTAAVVNVVVASVSA